MPVGKRVEVKERSLIASVTSSCVYLAVCDWLEQGHSSCHFHRTQRHVPLHNLLLSMCASLLLCVCVRVRESNRETRRRIQRDSFLLSCCHVRQSPWDIYKGSIKTGKIFFLSLSVLQRFHFLPSFLACSLCSYHILCFREELKDPVYLFTTVPEFWLWFYLPIMVLATDWGKEAFGLWDGIR